MNNFSCYYYLSYTSLTPQMLNQMSCAGIGQNIFDGTLTGSLQGHIGTNYLFDCHSHLGTNCSRKSMFLSIFSAVIDTELNKNRAFSSRDLQGQKTHCFSNVFCY